MSCMHILPATLMLTREKRNEILEKEKDIASGDSGVVAVAENPSKPQVPGSVKLVDVIKPGSFGTISVRLVPLRDERK